LALRLPQGQRPVLIPAWADGPGKRQIQTQGLKARVINDEPSVERLGSGLQPSDDLRGSFLGRRPRLVWIAPLALWQPLAGWLSFQNGLEESKGGERLSLSWERGLV
jgi:hypothetical protein